MKEEKIWGKNEWEKNDGGKMMGENLGKKERKNWRGKKWKTIWG